MSKTVSTSGQIGTKTQPQSTTEPSLWPWYRTEGEKWRIYHFPTGTLKIEHVIKLCVRPSGTHRLETADGTKWIIPVGWIAIEIDSDEWIF